MKQALLLSAIGLTLLSSCSTAFKSGQTPDDVYYSPGREIAAAKEEESDKRDQAAYQEYISSQDDRYLRMKVANRNRWTSLDDYSYWNDSRYDFCTERNYSVYNNPWNAGIGITVGYGSRPYYSSYGYGWSSPLYTVVAYGSPKLGTPAHTSGANISAYRNKEYNNANLGYKDPKTGAFVPSGSNNSFGNLLKRVFSNAPAGNNSSTTSYDRPARTFTTPTNTNTNTTPAPATSSSAGGHSGGYSSTGSSTSTGRGGRG